MIRTVLATALVVSSSACLQVLPGDGKVASRTLTVAAFAGLDTSSLVDVEATVAAGAPSVVLEGEENLLDALVVETRSEVLVIETRVRGTVLQPTERLVARVSAESFDRLETSGAADIVVTGTIAVPRLDTESSGNGSITVERVEATDIVTADVSGSGAVKLAGSVPKATFDLSGSGSVDAESLVAEAIELDLSGSGTLQATATSSASGEISGAGNATVHGRPTTQKVETSGAGSVSFPE